jgi:hypothetical protein
MARALPSVILFPQLFNFRRQVENAKKRQDLFLTTLL